MQERIVPLIRGIKTKEPAVMIAALKVLKQVGTEVDVDFIAVEVVPLLWNMALGPLLDLAQFKQFMELIKDLGAKVEQEHSRKLQELSGSTLAIQNNTNDDFMSFGDLPAAFTAPSGNEEDDFERLVTGKYGSTAPTIQTPVGDSGWDSMPSARAKPILPQAAPSFSWSSKSTPAPGPPSPGIGSLAAHMKPQHQPRTVTPDITRFASLQPQSTQFSQPLQPSRQASYNQPLQPSQPQQATVNGQNTQANANLWASSTATTSSSANLATIQPTKPNYTPSLPNYSSTSTINNSLSGLSLSSQQKPTSQPSTPFSLPPPPTWGQQSIQPQTQAAAASNWGTFAAPPPATPAQSGAQQQKKGLDAWESLI